MTTEPKPDPPPVLDYAGPRSDALAQRNKDMASAAARRFGLAVFGVLVILFSIEPARELYTDFKRGDFTMLPVFLGGALIPSAIPSVYCYWAAYHACRIRLNRTLGNCLPRYWTALPAALIYVGVGAETGILCGDFAASPTGSYILPIVLLILLVTWGVAFPFFADRFILQPATVVGKQNGVGDRL